MTSRPSLPGPGRPASWGLRLLGLTAGVAVALAVWPALRLPAGPAAMALIVDASVTRSGVIGLERGGQLLDGRVLHGGESGGVRGEVELVSEASVPLDVTVWDVGPPSGLEELLWVRITLDDAVLYDGSLATLRQTPSSAGRIDSGQRASLAAAVSLRPGAPDTFQGRRTELLLRLESKAVGG